MAGTVTPATASARRHELIKVGAKYILPMLAAVFLLLAALRSQRDRGRIMPASRTWLVIGIIFALVSTYLWVSA